MKRIVNLWGLRNKSWQYIRLPSAPNVVQNLGPFINYVDRILKIFDPSTYLRWHIYNYRVLHPNRESHSTVHSTMRFRIRERHPCTTLQYLIKFQSKINLLRISYDFLSINYIKSYFLFNTKDWKITLDFTEKKISLCKYYYWNLAKAHFL